MVVDKTAFHHGMYYSRENRTAGNEGEICGPRDWSHSVATYSAPRNGSIFVKPKSVNRTSGVPDCNGYGVDDDTDNGEHLLLDLGGRSDV